MPAVIPFFPKYKTCSVIVYNHNSDITFVRTDVAILTLCLLAPFTMALSVLSWQVLLLNEQLLDGAKGAVWPIL